MRDDPTTTGLHALLVRAVRCALPLQQRAGHFLMPPAINDYKTLYDQQIVVGIAYCLGREFRGNPWFGDRRVAKRLERALLWLLDEGQLAEPEKRRPLEHRNLRGTIIALDLAGHLLAPRVRDAVERAHADCIVALRERILRKRDVAAFDARTLDTGTNHFWGYLAVCAQLARRAGDEATLAELAPLAERLAAAQDPTGHWTENAGPTPLYTLVSTHFVGLAAEVFGTPALIEAARRASDFWMRFAFADGHVIECFDERVQAHHHPDADRAHGLMGAPALAFHPDGAAWYAFLAGRQIAHARRARGFASLEFAHYAVEALLRADRLRPRARWRTRDVEASGDGFGTVRTGRWQVGWQAMPTRDWPDNGFFLDRQSLFSLAHADVGRLVDGSNAKRQPELATFAASRGSYEFAERAPSLPTGGRFVAGAGLGTLHAEYPDFAAELSFTPRGRHELELRVATTPRGTALTRLYFNIALPFGWGDRIAAEGAGASTLGERAPLALAGRRRGWLASGRIRFACDRAHQATWPAIAFSSYRPPLHQHEAADARFVVSIELKPDAPESFTMRWRVAP